MPQRSSFVIDKDGMIRYRKVHDFPEVPNPDELIAVLKNLA